MTEAGSGDAPEIGSPPSTLASNRNYLKLFAAQVTSLVGSGVTSIALAAFAYELTGSNATVVVGTALMLRILAFVLLSPIAGILADRIDRRRLLVAADVIRMGLLALFPFVSTVAQIYALIFVLNAVTAFFTPTFEAALPDVVGQRLYTRAVSWSRIALALEAAIGPMVAGLFIAWIGVRWTFWVDGATYLVSALPRPVVHGAERAETDGTLPVVAARRAGIPRHVDPVSGAGASEGAHDARCRGNGRRGRDRHHDRLRTGRARTGDFEFALTMAAVGAGSAAVALILPRQAETARAAGGSEMEGHVRYDAWAERTLIVGGLLLAIALVPGIFVPGFYLLVVLWAINGAGQACVSIPAVGLLAEHTESGERGRAYAAHFAWTHLFWLGTYPAAGFLAREIGTALTFTVAGGACIVLTGLAMRPTSSYRPHPLIGAEMGPA